MVRDCSIELPASFKMGPVGFTGSRQRPPLLPSLSWLFLKEVLNLHFSHVREALPEFSKVRANDSNSSSARGWESSGLQLWTHLDDLSHPSPVVSLYLPGTSPTTPWVSSSQLTFTQSPGLGEEWKISGFIRWLMCSLLALHPDITAEA